MRLWEIIEGPGRRLDAMRCAVFVVLALVLVPRLVVAAGSGDALRFSLSDVVIVVGTLIALAVHVGRESRT